MSTDAGPEQTTAGLDALIDELIAPAAVPGRRTRLIGVLGLGAVLGAFAIAAWNPTGPVQTNRTDRTVATSDNGAEAHTGPAAADTAEHDPESATLQHTDARQDSGSSAHGADRIGATDTAGANPTASGMPAAGAGANGSDPKWALAVLASGAAGIVLGAGAGTALARRRRDLSVDEVNGLADLCGTSPEAAMAATRAHLHQPEALAIYLTAAESTGRSIHAIAAAEPRLTNPLTRLLHSSAAHRAGLSHRTEHHAATLPVDADQRATAIETALRALDEAQR